MTVDAARRHVPPLPLSLTRADPRRDVSHPRDHRPFSRRNG